MPAILGPGSVSLETCASEAQARMYRIWPFPRRGLFLQKKAFPETGFLLKAVDPRNALRRVFGNRAAMETTTLPGRPGAYNPL